MVRRAPGFTVDYFCDLGDSTLPLPASVSPPGRPEGWLDDFSKKPSLVPGECGQRGSAPALSLFPQETASFHPPPPQCQRSSPTESAYPMGRRLSAAGARASRRAAARGGWPPAARTRWRRCARLCRTRRAPSDTDTRRAHTPGSPRTASLRRGRTARPRRRRTPGSSCRGRARSRRDSGDSGTATRRSARGTTWPGAPGPAPARPERPGPAPAPAWRTGPRRAAARGTGQGRTEAAAPGADGGNAGGSAATRAGGLGGRATGPQRHARGAENAGHWGGARSLWADGGG